MRTATSALTGVALLLAVGAMLAVPACGGSKPAPKSPDEVAAPSAEANIKWPR